MAYNTIKEFQNAILNILKEAINDANKQVKEEIYNNLWYGWYMARPETESYQRTYQLLDSISISPTITSSNKISTSVYFDLSKIEAFTTGGFYNAHQSIDGSTMYGNHPISYHLISWIEEGITFNQNSNYFGNQPILEGVHMLERTSKWVESNLSRILKQNFSKYGLKLTTI